MSRNYITYNTYTVHVDDDARGDCTMYSFSAVNVGGLNDLK